MIRLWEEIQSLFREKRPERIYKKEVFIQNYSQNVPIGGNVNLVNMTVPSRCSMRPISFGNYSGTAAAWGTIYWDFLVDGSLLYPYNRIMDPIGMSSSRQGIQGIDISGGHNFIIRAYNPTAAICAMGISLEYELSWSENG